MTIVSTMATTKGERIYIRISSEIKEEFEKVAEYRGLKPSTLLHSLIVKTIHETKEERPQVFTKQNKGQIIEIPDAGAINEKDKKHSKNKVA